MDPKDERVHAYPENLDSPWKENFYFNFIDKENNAWGINHISLMRDKNKGRFSAIHVVDNQILLYANHVDIDDNLEDLTDGKLKFEFIEPFKKFRLTLDGPQHKADITFTARFDVFDYALDKAATDRAIQSSAPTKDKALILNHYEQGLVANGFIEKDGKTREINCFGHRDHSWGYRNEAKVGGWNWVAIQMADKTINMNLVRVGNKSKRNGFVSTKDGNARITAITVENTEFKDNLPFASQFTAQDSNGKTWRFASKKFSGLYLPMREKGGGVVVHENFSDFTDLDTGETGVGIDEYLINSGG